MIDGSIARDRACDGGGIGLIEIEGASTTAEGNQRGQQGNSGVISTGSAKIENADGMLL